MTHDVIIIGGGHNGLVAAAYLARAGRRVVVLERRHTVGGAAVSERPFGPDFLVTSLSYVVSLLPPDMVADLRLAEHGYHVYPQGPYFAPRRDGRHLFLAADLQRRHDEIAKFSKADADAYERWESWLAASAPRSARCWTRSRPSSAPSTPAICSPRPGCSRRCARSTCGPRST